MNEVKHYLARLPCFPKMWRILYLHRNHCNGILHY